MVIWQQHIAKQTHICILSDHRAKTVIKPDFSYQTHMQRLHGCAGDGVNGCTAISALKELPSRYVTLSRQGPLVCDVEYSKYAPGYIDDPTGASDTNESGNEVRPACLLPTPSKCLQFSMWPACCIQVGKPDQYGRRPRWVGICPYIQSHFTTARLAIFCKY